MVERMASTEAVLAQNTTILAQVQQHLGLLPIPLTPASAATGSAVIPLAAPAVIPVPHTASVAPPAAHSSAPTPIQEEDEVSPSTTN